MQIGLEWVQDGPREASELEGQSDTRRIEVPAGGIGFQGKYGRPVAAFTLDYVALRLKGIVSIKSMREFSNKVGLSC